MLHRVVLFPEGSEGESSPVSCMSASPSFSRAPWTWTKLSVRGGWQCSFHWLMLRFSKRPFFKGTVLYIVCVFVWAAHGHMHTWRSKTSQQSRFPPLVSAHKASPWQLRQNLSTWKRSICFFFFFFYFVFFLIWFPAAKNQLPHNNH